MVRNYRKHQLYIVIYKEIKKLKIFISIFIEENDDITAIAYII
jgi:hypothetical protein